MRTAAFGRLLASCLLLTGLWLALDACGDGAATGADAASNAGGQGGDAYSTPPPGSNDFYDAMIADPAWYRGWSFRPRAGVTDPMDPFYEDQLTTYAGPIDKLGQWVTYDAATESGKLVIPAFDSSAVATVEAAVDASQTTLSLSAFSGDNVAGRAFEIDDEIMSMTAPWDAGSHTVEVQRAQGGTAAASHAAGADVHLNTNSLINQLNFPLATEDGHIYLVIWEASWSDSFLHSGLTNHKAFNFRSPGIWLEPDASYVGGTHGAQVAGFDPDTDVAGWMQRSYGNPGGPATWTDYGPDGPNVTNNQPLEPQLATFVIKPNRWVRFFELIEQRANDYDVLNTWIADDATEPVHTHQDLLVNVGSTGITVFNLEFNTSTSRFVRGDGRDLVAFVRNLGVLRDPADVSVWLQRPQN
jgi:hypothetical protein